MQKHNVWVTDRLSVEAQVYLENQKHLNVTKLSSPNLKDQDLKGVEALLIRSRTDIDRKVLSKAPDLKLVVTATSGFDHIELEDAERKGVRVAFTPEANADAAAELTWMLVLECARKGIAAHRAVKSGEWSSNLGYGMQLRGKTYGIFGLGRIGTRVAKIAKGFGMSVLAHDPYLDDEAFEAVGAKRVGREEAVRGADVVSLHVPITRETRYLINKNTLDWFSRDAILVNTSRGDVVSEQDLAEALRKGKLRAVGLDVFEREPLNRESALLGFDNVIMSPHIGARTDDAFNAGSLQAAEQIAKFFLTGDLAHPLPPKAVWYTNPQNFD